MSARIIGDTGMKCLLVNREKGGTASFDGKYCKGPNESQCAELGKNVSGGTRWDAGAGACLLKDAAAVKTLNTTLTIAGGAVFTIGVTVLSGGTMAMVLLEAGGSVLFDLSFQGINRFYETRPNKLATEFVRAAQKCGLIGDDDTKMCSNKTCVKNLLEEFFASIDMIIGENADALNDEQLHFVDEINGRINDCYKDDKDIRATVIYSKVLTTDKFMSMASMPLIIGGLIISPSNTITKLMYLPKTAKILKRVGLKPIERISNTLGSARYYRIYADNLTESEMIKMIDELQSKGFYVSSNMDKDGKRFIGFSDQDVFGSWSNVPGNWFFGIGGAIDVNVLKLKASQNFDMHLSNVLASTLDDPYFATWDARNMTEAEWSQLNRYLRSHGVEIVDAIWSDGLAGKRIQRIGAKIDSGSGGRGVDIFSKVYNDMPYEVLNEKLKYVYEHSTSTDEAVRALKAVGAFDENVAQEMAQDIATETVRRIQNIGGQQLINRMRDWQSLSKQERETLVYNLHELVTTQRRNHAGNTLVDVFDEPGSGRYGSHLEPGTGRTREFTYNVSRDSIQDLLSTIIHENTHALQSIDKSSIHPAFVSWAKRNYVHPDVNYDLYYNNIVEIEARYVGKNAAAQVCKAIGIIK